MTETAGLKFESDLIEALLYEKFHRRARIKVGGDRGVLTACDHVMFHGLEFLVHSVLLSHDVRVAVVDLGLASDQRGWLASQGVEVLDLSDDLLVVARSQPHWQTWNKPVYIERSPFRATVWIDSDALVRGSLEPVFEMTEEKPFVVEDAHAPAGFPPANSYGLYKTQRFFLPERARTTVYPNAGVLGFVRGRDDGLLSAWKGAVAAAHASPVSLATVRWYDQGALIWTLESRGETGLIRRGQWCFNHPGREPTLEDWGAEFDSPRGFLESLPTKGASVVHHYTGSRKPWSRWDPTKTRIDLDDTVSRKMRVLLLSHVEMHFCSFRPRPFLEPVNLATLDVGRFQRNELAESRVYLDGGLMGRFGGREYVGLASTRWDDKYARHGGLRVQDLYKIKDRLRPDVVWAGCPTKRAPTWVETTCERNPGMGRVLRELEEFTGMPLAAGPSFWSNNFVCHRRVFSDFLGHFRRVFDHFSGRYDNRFDFVGMDGQRTPAYFYEAVTVHYFANRGDLTFNRLMDGDRIRM